MEHVLSILICAGIGLLAGVAGGIAGIGGSVIMLPALVLVFGSQTNHHVYQCSAMLVNVAIAYASFQQHKKSDAIRPHLLKRLWPSMAVAVVATVWFSKDVASFWPRVGLAAFVLVYCAYNFYGALRKTPDAPDEHETRSVPLLITFGALCGAASGFLAIGGGFVMVPLLQLIGRVQLKRAIATSAAVMAFTTPIGAAAKVGTVIVEGQDLASALLYAAGMTLGAIGGARLGVILNQKMSLPNLRLALSVILTGVAAKMAWDEIAKRQADSSPIPARVEPSRPARTE